MQKITPFLWFDNQAEEAAKFYTSIFKNSKINAVTHYGEAGPSEPGSVLTVEFELDGVSFVALNGGPTFKFTEAISLQIACETQEEVNNFWNKLTADGGAPSQCGWLKDKYGLSWQVVPTALPRLLKQPDAEKANRVMAAMLKMTKIEIAELERAAA
ncbi:putative 3-demethylubiquinone-9 3-methyltransferase (glyoxalase superfamily) [Pseudaminobacter salicylatoxidans]|uniref:Putative 3-demethylubiquinone-9 3-methyltransferase (Glyoxalase superfamily) n=1 Tax=Pseudaminobacter salicylatoxidans TaxID=93369 RepID=A0A316C3H2_PSESE|nr:VOC family protein [Pseudaminobacter salicylatoxidans]PWJ84302.1 putative 3-demethylubiquinone-9 3-methyltransferase (glyoxalase superfamily) [Pseudaminobacter salicylatoxidans]